MEDERTAIIVKEIRYWRSHKLLPDTYCDYLLALYTNGETTIDSPKKGLQKIGFILCLIIQMLLVPFSFLVIYFTEFPVILQLSILLLFILFSFWQYWWLNRRGSTFYHVSLISLLLLIFLTIVLFCSQLFDNQWLTLSMIILQFICWLILGMKRKWNYVIILSVIGLAFTSICQVL
ncbi:hypothetical protein WMZ97_20830 [Lentibacillus sp. N15]|uniref:hypothetical protein n=1 Tax=Lentibacillus songyuanensis TaxID=3136161 RepID=UPI0031BB131F